MAVSPKFHGAIPIADNSDNADVSGNTLSIYHGGTGTTAYYFIRAYTGESIATNRLGAQLVEEIQARVRLFSGFGAFNCTVSDTGFVTMSRGSTFTVTWTDTGLRDILGFTGNLSGASSYTATNQHMHGWYPGVALVDRIGDERSPGMATSDVQVMRTPGGAVNALDFTGELYDRTFEFNWLPRQRALKVPTLSQTTSQRIVNQSYEEFWAQSKVRRFRWYPDSTLQVGDVIDNAGAPNEYRFDETSAQKGTGAAERSIALHDELYKIAFAAHRVAAGQGLFGLGLG
jgi:hypothetical protein